MAALGVTSTAIAGAGCLGSLIDDETGDSADENENETRNETDAENSAGDDGNDSAENDSETDETNETDSRWPAIEAGEVLSDFEDLDRWEVSTGRIEAAPDEARTGTQAATIESDGGTAGASIFFPDGLDLEGWDVSMAVKPNSASRIVVEFIAPTSDERLTTVRPIPNGYDGWFRLDCGYEHKPAGEPDLSNVSRLNVIAVGPEGEPTEMLVDDLRRTEAVDNGKAILAFYDGHRSHFDIAAEMLEERGWAGAVPVDPRRVGDRGRMGFDELRRLRDRGWDVCSYPRIDSDLTEQSEDRQRKVVESLRDSLEDRGFADGSRHFFAPSWRQMTPETNAIVREFHESGFLFGSCPTGAPPTGIHTTPVIWGPALHNGVRRHINLCDQYKQLTVIRIPPIVADEDAGANNMSLEDFEHLLDHIEHRGLEVITPSDMVDGTMGSDDGDEESATRPDGTVLDAGESHSFEGTGAREAVEFDLSDGILVTEASHDGDSDFAVEVTPVGGDDSSERLSTTSETTTGTSITLVDGGTHQFDVDAEGAWSIEFDQPEVHSDDLAELPVEASGTGPSFVGPLWTPSDVRLTATHDGEGEFIVDGHGADGHREQLIHKTGAFDNSRSYSAGGTVWIDVEADGEWTLTVSES